MSENNNDKNHTLNKQIDEMIRANPIFVKLIEQHFTKQQPQVDTKSSQQIIDDFSKQNPEMMKRLAEYIKNNPSPIPKDSYIPPLTPEEREDIRKNMKNFSHVIGGTNFSEILDKAVKSLQLDGSKPSQTDVFSETREEEFAQQLNAAEASSSKISTAELKLLIKEAAGAENVQPFADLFKQFDALDAKKAELPVTPQAEEQKGKLHLSVPNRTKPLSVNDAEVEKNKGNKPK